MNPMSEARTQLEGLRGAPHYASTLARGVGAADVPDPRRSEMEMAEVTLELLGKRLDELQGEATHYRLVFDVILKEVKSLTARMDVLDSRMNLLENRMDRLEARMDRLETRVESLEERIMTRFDALEHLLRGEQE
jgi:chaperonin cofactor prefoldin